MKVLILGGTGAMGKYLVESLSAKSFESVVTSRKPMQSSPSVSYIQGNAHEISFLESILKDKWDAIVDFMNYKTPEFAERVALFLKSTSQYFFLSSARVYADSMDPITEESPRLLDVSTDQQYLATDEYALAKARQENVLFNSKNTNWTIIRPYITYADNRLQLGVLEKEEWLYRVLHGRSIVFSNDICKKLTTMTSGVDIARAIISLIGKSSALGQAFNITSGSPIAWHNVLDIYLDVLEKHLGYKPKVVMQNLDRFTEWKRAPYQIKYDRLFNRKFDNTKISHHVDVSRFTAPEVGLRKCLGLFLAKPIFGNFNWSSEAVKDRQTKELSSLREISSLKNKARYLTHRYF